MLKPAVQFHSSVFVFVIQRPGDRHEHGIPAGKSEEETSAHERITIHLEYDLRMWAAFICLRRVEGRGLGKAAKNLPVP
jgi:hypothetical protein